MVRVPVGERRARVVLSDIWGRGEGLRRGLAGVMASTSTSSSSSCFTFTSFSGLIGGSAGFWSSFTSFSALVGDSSLFWSSCTSLSALIEGSAFAWSPCVSSWALIGMLSSFWSFCAGSSSTLARFDPQTPFTEASYWASSMSLLILVSWRQLHPTCTVLGISLTVAGTA